MNYGRLITEAFWISWRNRFLWIFGFLLGGGSQILGLLQNANNFSRQRPPFLGDYLGEEAILSIFEARRLVLDNLVLFLISAVVLVLVAIFLSVTSQGALVDGVAALHRDEDGNFSSALRAGLSNFWRVLGFSALFLLIALVIGLIFAITMIVVVLITASVGSPEVRLPFFILFFLLFIGFFILVFIPLSIVFLLGLQALVIDRESIFGSFGSGFDLLVQRFGRVLLVWVIGFGLSLGASLALLTLALLLGLLLAVPALIFFAAGLSTTGIVAGVIAGGVLLILYLIAASAVATFNHAYWTLAYLRLTTGGAAPQPEQEA